MSKTKMTHEEQEELRKNAPIPKGMKDYRNCILQNTWNGIVSKVTGYEVCDSGVILWRLDTKSQWYTPRDLERNWTITFDPIVELRGDVE